MDEDKAESQSMLLSPQEKEANGEFRNEKEDQDDNDSMLLSPHPRPRTVTCISAPDDSSPGSTRQRSVTSPYSSRPRSKSIRNQVDQHSDIFLWLMFLLKFMCLGSDNKDKFMDFGEKYYHKIK